MYKKIKNEYLLCVLVVLAIGTVSGMEYSYTQNASSDAKLLSAICNGPRPEDHPFHQAGFIELGTDEQFSAQVANPQQDSMTASMINFGQNALDPLGPLKEKESQIKVRTVVPHLKPHGILALVCVHGTYSKDIGFGDNLEKKSTHNIIDFAKKLGVAHNKAVRIVSFVWSGLLDLEARKLAGKQLAEYLMHKDTYDELWTIAHSHGCNVVNWAAFTMLEEGFAKQIDTAIHLVSPLPDLQVVQPEGLEQATSPESIFNMKKLYHFYGSNDSIGVLASLQSAWQSGRKTRPGRDSHCTAYNVRTQLNGQQLDHLNIKEVIAHLPGLLHAIDTYYTCFFDLDANLIALPNGMLEYPMVANRKVSNDPHHPALRENYRRALAYSTYQAERYKKRYGDRSSIGYKPSIVWRVFTAPLFEWWGSADHDKYEEPKSE